MRFLRYDGAWSLRALYVRRRILNSLLNLTGSQSADALLLTEPVFEFVHPVCLRARQVTNFDWGTTTCQAEIRHFDVTRRPSCERRVNYKTSLKPSQLQTTDVT